MSVITMAPTRVATGLVSPMTPMIGVVRSIRPEAYGISTFTMSLADEVQARAFRFKPGQFNMLFLPGFGEVAISMSSDPAEPLTFAHTIRFAGNVTRGLARLKSGDQIGVRGPFGTPWPVEKAVGKDLMIAAGGIGMAPLRPLVYEVMRRRDEFRKVLLLYGARTPADLLYTDEFDRWREAGIEVLVTVDRADDQWRGQIGVVPLLFYRVKLDHKETVMFACGPEVMMRFVIYEALARRVPNESIWVSVERNMKCGYGVCGHCQYGPYFVCKDGPVFSFADVERFYNKEEF